jgi:hypothetical protein
MASNKRWAYAWLLMGVFALGVRLGAAQRAYPCAGDAGHFVQHGVALANGVPGAMSTYWSQGMIALAAGGVKLGLDPRRVLQGATLVSGLLQVVFFAWLLYLLTRSHGLSYAGGWFMAVSPAMVQHSITGYSEMPYMAFLTMGICVGVLGLSNRHRWLWLAGGLIGLGGYFKGPDAAIAACGFGLFALLWTKGGWQKKVLMAGIVPIAAFVVLIPLCTFTYLRTGTFAPSAKGQGNLMFVLKGGDWTDSKAGYSVDTGRYAQGRAVRKTGIDWNAICHTPKRMVPNAVESVRVFNRQIFSRGFRMGTFWFFLFVTGAAYVWWRKRDRRALLPLCLLVIQLAMLSLVFVHSRILLPSLPWLVLLLLLSGAHLWNQGPAQRWILGVVLAAYLTVNARYALDAFESEFFWWRYANIEVCAKELKKLGGTDADVVMSYGPTLAVEFNQTNPLKTVEVPYGTIEQVSEIADQNHVRFIVVSDAFRTHWPIARLFDEGVPSPANWALREELVFPEEEWTGSRGHPAERCRIYERLPMIATKGVER